MEYLKLVYSRDSTIFEPNKSQCAKCGVKDSQKNKVYDFLDPTNINKIMLCEKCVDMIFSDKFS